MAPASFADYEPDAHGVPLDSVVVQEAARRDVPAIAALADAARGEAAATSAESIRAAVADRHRFVAFAAVDSVVVGWAKTHHFAVSAGEALAGHYLGGVTIHPTWRRRGIATLLTTIRLDWIWQRADAAWCVVNARNAASIALHERVGFAEVARAARFHSTRFVGGEGILLRMSRP